MKKLIAVTMFLAAMAAPLLAHAGHIHTYMGTVTMLHGPQAFMMKTTDGKELTVAVSPKTTWAHADGHAAAQSELAVGERVVVKTAIDGKTAANVKMSAPGAK